MFVVLFFNLNYSLNTCTHADASAQSYDSWCAQRWATPYPTGDGSNPYDWDNDGLRDEYCFKDSGNCPCTSVNCNCYGCWRDLKPPSIINLRVCYILNGKKVCDNLDPNNPVFVIEKNEINKINITWETTENAKCVFRFIYDETGNKTDLSLSNKEVKSYILPNSNSGDYSKSFIISLDQNSTIRFKIDCFDKDTLEGPNYPPNVEVDKSCDILNNILTTDTCKYKGSIGPIIVLDKDKYNFIKIQILDPNNQKILENYFFYQARKIRGLNILLESTIFRFLNINDYCTKEGTYKLNIIFNETSNNFVNYESYSWNVDWDKREFCKEDCVGKEVIFGIPPKNSECCGDDLNEFPKYKKCFLNTCNTNLSDKACCNNENDCVFNNNCYSEGTKLDIDNDGLLEICEKGVWVPRKGVIGLLASVNKNKVKIDEYLTINLNSSVESGNRIKGISFLFEKNGKEVILLEKYYNESININKNVSLMPIKNYINIKVNKLRGIKEFIVSLNKSDLDIKNLRILINNKEFFFPSIIYTTKNKVYLFVSSELYKNEKSLNLNIHDFLFIAKNINVKKSKIYPDNFYLGVKSFTSSNISVNKEFYENYKVLCLDNNKLLPFKLENNNLIVLESCNDKLLLSKIPEEGSDIQITFEPSLYLKFK